MKFNPETNPANLCRVCLRDITDAPSENIFVCSDPDQISIYVKLSAVCNQIFTTDKPLADEVLTLPLNVCHDCKRKIDEAYELHKMCVESHRLLREWLAPSTLEEVIIKEEPLDIIETEPGHFTALSQSEEAKIFVESLVVPDAEGKAEEPGKFQCEKCNLRTRRHYLLHKHMKIKHRNEVVECDKCYEAFFDQAKFEEHRKIHRYAKPYQCPNCLKRFKTRRETTVHRNRCKVLPGSMEAKANEEDMESEEFQCEKCDKRTSLLHLLHKHMKIKHRSEVFGCDKCYEAFFDETKLEEHRKIHGYNKPYQCPKCLKQFKGRKDARAHGNRCKGRALPKLKKVKVLKERRNVPKVEAIEKEPGNFQCEKCDKRTRLLWLLHKHMKVKHRNEVFGCDKCYEAFFDEAKLEEHRKIHGYEKPYQCPNCLKRFKNRRLVVLHGNHCKGNTPFLCTICGKAYAYHSSLKHHMLVHKEKTVACDRCSSKFYTKGALKNHLMSVHATEKPISCEFCGDRFTTKCNLSRHLLCHSDVRRYPCTICDMRFKKSCHLQRHMCTHTGEKPHKCTHCDRAFAQSNDLIKHIKTHVGQNPYKCDQCEAAFRLKVELRVHLEVHFRQQNGGGGGSREEPEVTSELNTQLDNDSK